MKIAIISDIHDNFVNLGKCLDWCAAHGVDALICCGDVTNAETLKMMSKKFNRVIYLVRGNVEIYNDSDLRFDNIKYLGRIGRVELGGKNVGICHEPFLIEKVLELGKCDLIFYGHTHKPWAAPVKAAQAINPGTLGAVFQKATFAVWDTAEKEPILKVLELL